MLMQKVVEQFDIRSISDHLYIISLMECIRCPTKLSDNVTITAALKSSLVHIRHTRTHAHTHEHHLCEQKHV